MFLISALCLVIPASATRAGEAPYVNSAIADEHFGRITAADMEVIRSKRILFASRSFGLNLRGGLASLAKKNPKLDILSSLRSFDVNDAGGDVSIIPRDIFDGSSFVHFLATLHPYHQRVLEMEQLLRQAPHYFADDVDVVMIYYHHCDPGTLERYCGTMDRVRKDFPHIRFVYVTAGFMDARHNRANAESAAFSKLIRERYQGRAPLYDLGYLLSRDGECGNCYCPEYSTDPAGVHPNTDKGQEQMAKGFLVMLHKLFCEDVPRVKSLNAPPPPTDLSLIESDTTSIRLGWAAAAQPDGIERYRVLRNGTQAGSSRSLAFTDHGVQENREYTYTVQAVARNGKLSVESAPLLARSLNDTTPPKVLKVHDALHATEVRIEFNEPLDKASAENPAHYRIAKGARVVSATLSGRTVLLQTAQLPPNQSFALSIQGVTDRSINRNAVPSTPHTFRYICKGLDDMLAHWSFDGTVESQVGNEVRSLAKGQVVYETGRVGQALRLDGTKDGAYVTARGRLDDVSEITLSLWVRKHRPEASGTALLRHVVYHVGLTKTGFDGYLFNDKRVRGRLGSRAGLDDTHWHHLCVVYDGKAIKSYLDAQVVSSRQFKGRVARRKTDVYIGKNPWGTCFDGLIDEVRIFDWALDAGQVAELAGTATEGMSDSEAVRALLDHNGLTKRKVEGAAVFDKAGRVVQLNIQECGVTEITDHVGHLTELRKLHCYGDRKLGHPLLQKVSPAIGKCSGLQELLLNQNELRTLPHEITKLRKLDILSIGENRLKLDGPLREWADRFDPDWAERQRE